METNVNHVDIKVPASPFREFQYLPDSRGRCQAARQPYSKQLAASRPPAAFARLPTLCVVEAYFEYISLPCCRAVA